MIRDRDLSDVIQPNNYSYMER